MKIYKNEPIKMEDFLSDLSPYRIAPAVIFDIGSRDGADARILHRAFPAAQVFAFEAAVEEHQYFAHENQEINWLNIAISSFDGEATFFNKGFNSGIHSFRDRGQEYGARTDIIPCMRVDTFCKSNNIQKVDIVKIDVEGCSYEVISSFGDYLPTVQAFHIETESHAYFKDQRLEEEVFGLLRKHFNLVAKSDFTEKSLFQSDSIWVSNTLL